MVKVISGSIEPATLRRKTFSGHSLELVVRSLFIELYTSRPLLCMRLLHC